MRRLLFQFVGCTAVCLALILSGCKSKKLAETTVQPEQTTEQQVVNIEKEEKVTPMTNIHVKITTTQGTMVVRLYDETPKHRDNFVKLVEEGYYDSLIFHRCIRNFMIQGGDPNSRGAAPGAQLGVGGPGYTIDAEFDSTLFHKKGALAAARQADFVNPARASSGSQFYIVQGQKMNDAQIAQMEQYVKRKNPTFAYSEEQKEIYRTLGGTAQLDMDYTVFGEVVEGLDVIDKIAALPTAVGDRPVEDVIMSMEIVK